MLLRQEAEKAAGPGRDRRGRLSHNGESSGCEASGTGLPACLGIFPHPARPRKIACAYRYQNCRLSENWKERGGSCAVIFPNEELVGSVVGPRSTGSFKALKVSPRNRIRKRSLMVNVLFSEKSQRRCE